MSLNIESFDLILLNADCVSEKEIVLFLNSVFNNKTINDSIKNIYVFNCKTSLELQRNNLHCFNVPYTFENFINFVLNDTTISDNYLICKNIISLDKLTMKNIFDDSIYLEPQQPNREGTVLNNLCIINNMFSFKSIVRSNKKKFFNLKYSFKQNLQNIELSFFDYLAGFKPLDVPLFFNKKCIKDFDVGLNKFNDKNSENPLNVNDFSIEVLRYIKLMNGDFKPCKYRKLVKRYEK